MSKPRRRPNKTEMLAACLLMLGDAKGHLVPDSIRRTGTADDICRSVVWHHEVYFAIHAHNNPRLLTPMRKVGP